MKNNVQGGDELLHHDHEICDLDTRTLWRENILSLALIRWLLNILAKHS